MIDNQPTPRLAEFRAAEAEDSNAFWRLESGDHQNLLDQAIEQIDALAAELAEERAAHEKFVEDLSSRMPAVDGDGDIESLISDWFSGATTVLDVVQNFVHARREFVGVLRQYSTQDMADYHRWTGHSESRLALAEELGWEMDPETGGLLDGPEAGRA